MKRSILSYSILACILAFFALSFAGVNYAETFAPPPPGTSYRYTFTADTLTDSENDTLYMPASWGSALSRFTYSWQIVKTNLSGTTNAAVILQETNEASAATTAGSWMTRDSAAGGATALVAAASGEEIYGLRQRVIIDARGATQSTRYVLRLVIKKK